MTIAATLIAIVSLASLLYVSVVKPDYLRRTREGVAYFTPPVEHPDTSEALTLDTLIEHYKGE